MSDICLAVLETDFCDRVRNRGANPGHWIRVAGIDPQIQLFLGRRAVAVLLLIIWVIVFWFICSHHLLLY